MNLFPLQDIFFQGNTIRVENLSHGIKRLVLARPQTRNALSFDMISEMCAALDTLANLKDIAQMRALVIAAEGSAFSGGADLHDMKLLASQNFTEAHPKSQLLAHLFYKMASFPAPTLAAVQGAAIAGATGLLACIDHVIASPNAKFALPEVRLGLVAATISPYLIRKLGSGHALSLMLTARKLNVEDAHKLGLVHDIAENAGESALEKTLQSRLEEIVMGAPQAQRASKSLTIRLAPLPDTASIEYTAQTLSKARGSEEGKNGLSAFFDGTTPQWCAEFVVAKNAVQEDT